MGNQSNTGEELRQELRELSPDSTTASEGFARKAAIESTISIAMRFWQEKDVRPVMRTHTQCRITGKKGVSTKRKSEP